MPEDGLNKIEIRSEEIQDILGQVPRWIVRWGTVMVLFTVVILIIGSYFYKFPDIKKANIIVTTENPPATLVARTDGQIESITPEENEFVEAGTHLVVIENPASYSDVISLRFDIEEIKTTMTSLGEDEEIELSNSYSLGEIQSAYADFVTTYKDYYQFLKLDYHNKTIRSKQQEIRRYRNLSADLQRQTRILEEDFKLASIQYSRDSGIYATGYSSDLDLERSKQAKLQKQLNLEESRTRLSETEIQIAQLDQEILNLELTATETREQKQAAIREAFDKLAAQIDIWEQNYLLIAPIDGRVTLSQYWSENQNVRKGDKVLTIIPEDQGEIIGRITNLSVEGSGKVDTGRRVNIQFANYPHLEYGMVRGKIRSISQVPEDEYYSVEVELPDGLTTYYNKEIPFNQEMQGRAEIITDDRRLIERIFSPIRSMLSEQKAGRID
jgi:HlyD family secretion protein